jgi:Tol biopolymer transport system component
MMRLITAFLLALTASAQTAQLTEQLGRTEIFQDVAVSPDGARLAWTRTRASAYEPRLEIALATGSGRVIPVSAGSDEGRRDSNPAWSPDSRTIAFFTTGAPDQPQLWTVSADGRHARRRAELQGYAAHPLWSHDGLRIAFLYIEGAGGGGPLYAAPAMTGVIDTEIHNQRIAVLDVASGRIRMVSPPDLHVYDFDWSPDDRAFVATAAPGPGDNNWWIAQLHTFDSSTGQGKSIYKPALQVAVPRWSPDGRTIAFIEGLMSDEGFHGGDLFTVPATGGQAVDRTKGRKTSASSEIWTSSGRLLFTEYQGGGSAISELDPGSSAIRSLWQGPEGVHAFGNFPNFSASRDGSVTAVVRSGFTQPPEVWSGGVNAWKQITHANAGEKF